MYATILLQERIQERIQQLISIAFNAKKLSDYHLTYGSDDEKEIDAIINIGVSLDLLNEIGKDISNDVIPEAYYPMIYDYTSDLNIEHLPRNDFQDDNEVQAIDKHQLISYLTNEHISKSKDMFLTYKFLRGIEFAYSNTVIVGANGSGKSSLSSRLSQGINKKVGVVIPSQKLLLIPTLDSIPNHDTTISEFEKLQHQRRDDRCTYMSNKPDELPYEQSMLYTSEFNIIMRKLFAEQASIQFLYCEKQKNGQETDKSELTTTLDKVIKIWNYLIEHRTIFCNDPWNLSVREKRESESNDYPAYQMSDGEKVIIYLISRVLLAPKDGLIVIDEPELYLHKAIVDKLWNILELERKDCIFIYLTHDLDFAASRNAKKFWIKSFTYPDNWDIEAIPENEIPESLLMEILGSRKKILFCEGVAGGKSLDMPILEALFPNYTIRPVGSCREVINYTKAFNTISNKNETALGIIDRDFRDENEPEMLKKDKVYTFEAAEIENLLLVEDFIEAFAAYKNEDIDLNSLKNNVLIKFSSEKETQVIQYITRQVNQRLKGNPIQRKKTKEDIISSLNQITTDIDIDCMYDKRAGEIEEIIKNDAYDRAILVYNNKGLRTTIEESFRYAKNTYHQKALEFLQKSDEAKEILRRRFPDELVKQQND